MAKFIFLLLPILFSLLQLPTCVQPQINSPFPVVYPVDVGNVDHVREFFQFSQAKMGYTRIFFTNSKKAPRLSANINGSRIDMGSLIYRTHKKKGILFHFEGIRQEEGIVKIHQIINVIDRESNVYRLPILMGPEGSEHTLMDHKRFLTKLTIKKAKVAFGFSEAYKKALDNQTVVGYTQVMIEELANITDPYCKQMDSNFYVAFNAYYVGAAAQDVNFDFYRHFKRCRLLLYSLPNQPVVNVARVKELLLNHVNMNRMLVLCAGRHIAHRLFSLESVAWGYAKGHYKAPNNELGESGLLSIMNSGASIYRVQTYELKNRKILKYMAVFRNMFESDMYRNNFDTDILPYLAQASDFGHVTVLYPYHWRWPQDIMEVMTYYDVQNMPFFEARTTRGPNPDFYNANHHHNFWQAMLEIGKELGKSRNFKPVFSFAEGHGQYSQHMIEEMVKDIITNAHRMPRVRFGIMLEITAMGRSLDFSQFLNVPAVNEMFQYVFLKDDFNKLREEHLQEMKHWVPKFKDKILFLMMNDRDDKVNMIYRFFARVEPNDTSAGHVPTPAPGETTVVTKLTTEEETTTPIIFDSTTLKPEPPAINNTANRTKSGGALVSPWSSTWAASLVGMVVCTAVVLDRIL